MNVIFDMKIRGLMNIWVSLATGIFVTFTSLYTYDYNFCFRFFPRWKEWESMQAETLQYSLDEDQWEQDWASILSLASQPGTSLEQTHVFALAHILRRPIIIYGVKYVKSFRGETLGLARFEGEDLIKI